MSRLKDQIIEEENNFWDKAIALIGPNFMMNSPSSTAALTEELQEGWNEFWENKNA